MFGSATNNWWYIHDYSRIFPVCSWFQHFPRWFASPDFLMKLPSSGESLRRSLSVWWRLPAVPFPRVCWVQRRRGVPMCQGLGRRSMGDGQWLKSGDELFFCFSIIIIMIIVIICIISFFYVFFFFTNIINFMYYCVSHHCYYCLYYMLSVQHQSCKPTKYRNVLLQATHFDLVWPEWVARSFLRDEGFRWIH